jgi:hypothetical protein
MGTGFVDTACNATASPVIPGPPLYRSSRLQGRPGCPSNSNRIALGMPGGARACHSIADSIPVRHVGPILSLALSLPAWLCYITG